MTVARTQSEREFTDFLAQFKIKGEFTSSEFFRSFKTLSRLSRNQLLAKNKDGLSWMMVCLQGIRNSTTMAEVSFYTRQFNLLIRMSLFSKDCFQELIALTDNDELTVINKIEELQLHYLYDHFLFELACSKKDWTTRLGNHKDVMRCLKQLRLHQHHFPGCDVLLLDDFPEPTVQYGPNCGYYAMSNATKYWSLKDSAYRAYPARLFGPDKKLGTSLKKLGKKAGMKGVGGIYDVNYFASILKDTPYHSQVVDFETEDEFHALLKLALAHNCLSF